ncbi:MAG: di-trans,poly-cis-decaprenylcistransferase [Bacilli bacterium]|nr:di-trans,poly-cis-decaprenylcistransferase [Bacilli bacterium]
MENSVPNHVGIIMDGNGRWAVKHGMIRSLGHKKGADNLKSLVQYVFTKGVKCLSVYAFSTENFKRDKEEVDYLMNLIIKFFNKEKSTFVKNKIKVLVSGSKDNLRSDVIAAIEGIEEATKDFTDKVFNVCFNYGGRLEIVDTLKKIIDKVQNNELDISSIDENLVSSYMYKDLPDLDFVIRTSGELRTSNFMLWQSSYAEYYFPETLFPDFDEKEFDIALEEYSKRKRRFGGV